MEKRWEMPQVGKIRPNQMTVFLRKSGLALGFALLGLGISGCFSDNPPSSSAPGGPAGVKKLKPAPEFALPDSAGQVHRISDYRGKLVLLHFWASWCPPCLGEIPQWVEIANDFKGRNLQMIAVSLDDGWPAALKVLPTEKLPTQIVSLLDSKSSVSEIYGSYAFPETYLINQKGEIITKWIGPQDWKGPAMVQLFERFLKE